MISEELLNFVESTDILPGYKTDHSMVSMNFSFSDLVRGKGYWKLNNILLRNKEYVDLVKSIIKDVIKQYVATPHNPDNIDAIHSRDLVFQISDQLLRGSSSIWYDANIKVGKKVFCTRLGKGMVSNMLTIC